jgi:hypothetical protein
LYLENDDKLIQMLKSEIKRMESAKGVKSQLTGGGTASVAGSQQSQVSDIAKLKAENGRLKNQVKCLEIEVE